MDQILLLIISIVAMTVIITDYRSQRIPNGITYPTMVFAVIYHFLMSGQSGMLSSLGGLMLGISLLLIPYLMGGIGAGDVKFLGALGALTGPSGVFYIALYAALAGGVYAIIFMIVNNEFGKRLVWKYFSMIRNYLLTRQFVSDDLHIDRNGPKLCYGIAISIGTYLYLSELLFGFNIISKSLHA